MKCNVVMTSLLLSSCLSGALFAEEVNCDPKKPVKAFNKKNDRIVGVWNVDVERMASPLPRPVSLQFFEDGNLLVTSGTNVAQLGFDARSAFTGQWQFKCKKDNHRVYCFEFEEFLYSGGFVAGRFLVASDDVVVTCNGKDRCNDTIGCKFSFRITRFIYENCDPINGQIIDEIIVAEATDGLFNGVRFLTDPFYSEFAGINLCPTLDS